MIWKLQSTCCGGCRNGVQLFHRSSPPFHRPSPLTTRPSHAGGAFSLVELLVVIGLIVILLALAVPAYERIARGMRLGQTGQLISDQLAHARQLAITRNLRTEVRFFEAPGLFDGETGFGKIRVYLIHPDGEAEPFGRLHRIPEVVALNPTQPLSTLLGESSPNSGNETLAGNINASYRGFRFNPDGSTNLPPSQEHWTLTLHYSSDRMEDDETLPPNFFTLRIDPFNGNQTIFRP